MFCCYVNPIEMSHSATEKVSEKVCVSNIFRSFYRRNTLSICDESHVFEVLLLQRHMTCMYICERA